MKKIKSLKTRNWVAVHMETSGTGFHTEKKYSRKTKHKQKPTDISLVLYKEY